MYLTSTNCIGYITFLYIPSWSVYFANWHIDFAGEAEFSLQVPKDQIILFSGAWVTSFKTLSNKYKLCIAIRGKLSSII